MDKTELRGIYLPYYMIEEGFTQKPFKNTIINQIIVTEFPEGNPKQLFFNSIQSNTNELHDNTQNIFLLKILHELKLSSIVGKGGYRSVEGFEFESESLIKDFFPPVIFTQYISKSRSTHRWSNR